MDGSSRGAGTVSSETAVPPLVLAVESVLETKVLALRYLPSPSAAAAVMAEAAPREEAQPES